MRLKAFSVLSFCSYKYWFLLNARPKTKIPNGLYFVVYLARAIFQGHDSFLYWYLGNLLLSLGEENLQSCSFRGFKVHLFHTIYPDNNMCQKRGRNFQSNWAEMAVLFSRVTLKRHPRFFFHIFSICFINYFMKNPQTTFAPTFLTHIIARIDGVLLVVTQW